MIIDTSALIAAITAESSADGLREILSRDGGRISAATLVEARIVAYGKGGPAVGRRLESVLRWAGTEIVPFDAAQADAAADAYRDYGRGSGHPARLNLGDTFSYALASIRDEPLLYVGDEFGHTDIRSALGER